MQPRSDIPPFEPFALTRIPITGVLVWGLLTFWAFTAWRLASVWQAHVQSRWTGLAPTIRALNLAPDAAHHLQQRGFTVRWLRPGLATCLLAASGVLTLGWFLNWIVLDGWRDERLIVGAVALSSVLFYAGACLLMAWLWRAVQAHEQAEAWLQDGQRGNLQTAATAAFDLRWERAYNQLALFLVVGLPIVFLPTLGAYLVATRQYQDGPLSPAVACFLAAVVFHLWGSRLLVNLCNDHFAAERAPAGDAVGLDVAGVVDGSVADAVPEPYDGAEPYVFVSYRRADFDRVAPALVAVGRSGYRLWYDKGIPGGAEWDALIETKLQGCALLLFFVSHGSVQSKHCRREVKYADQLNKPILSVRLEPVALGHGLEMLLTQYQMVDANHAGLMGEIGRALKHLRLL